MKKLIFFTIFISIIITFFCFYSVNLLHNDSQKMFSILKELDKAVEVKDWKLAEVIINDFEKKWTKNKKMWKVLIDHAEIDNIEISIVHIKSYIKTQNLSEVKAEIDGLNQYILHIPETEKLNLGNIF